MVNYWLGLVLLFVCEVYSQVTTIPVQLYTTDYGTISPKNIKYYKVQPCLASCAGYKWALLSIVLPSNPTWKSNNQLVVVELSTSQYMFDYTTVFATNYVWASSTFSPQIEWDWTQYLDQTGAFYARVTAPIASVEYSFQIQFEVDGLFMSGTYDFAAFYESAVAQTTNFNRLSQYAFLLSGTVNNGETKNYFVQFCTNDWPSDCNKNSFSITTTVIEDPSRPMSQFNLYACPWTYNGCGIYNYKTADRSATGVVQVVVSNPEYNATQGVYFTVYGIGGQSDGINQYKMTIVAEPTDGKQ